MILAFKQQFVSRIIEETKLHTIRKDPTNRWKQGNTIQCATGVRTKNYNCFKEAVCISVQEFEIQYSFHETFTSVRIFIDKRIVGTALIEKCVVTSTTGLTKQIAAIDGFKSVNEFLEWFSEDFQGKIIHWTDLRY